MAAFNSLGHVAFRVNDLEASLAFYAKLGFPEFLRLTQDDGRPWIAYLKITDQLYLELFPGGDGGKAVGPEHTGVHHLCLTTDDIEATAAPPRVRRHSRHCIALVPPSAASTATAACGSPTPTATASRSWKWRQDCVQYEALKAVGRGEAPHVLKRPI